jgi:hypothetical protein
MTLARSRRNNIFVVGISLLLFLVLCFRNTASGAQEAKELLPIVSSANVPFYPRTPRIAHIEGEVRLRLSTDGVRVSSIDVVSGQAMLAQAAEENIRTWVFEKHTPMTFETTFRYTLLSSKCDSNCNCDDLRNGTALLHLPTKAEVSASDVIICAPAKRPGPSVLSHQEGN